MGSKGEDLATSVINAKAKQSKVPENENLNILLLYIDACKERGHASPQWALE